jgi:K+-sensing histidine kinase KdpD
MPALRPPKGLRDFDRATLMKAIDQAPGSMRRMILVASFLSLLVMACIDYFTGIELIFSAAYLVPVALCAWYLGPWETWVMSILGGVVSWYVDRVSDHVYSHYAVQYWNAFVCFLICIVCGLLLLKLRRLMREREQVNDDLRRSLEELARSTDEIRKLQDGLQVVCAWTKQIKVGDRWMTPDEFLTTQLHLKLTHGMSPEGARIFGNNPGPRPPGEPPTA